MRPLSTTSKHVIDSDPFYKRCSRWKDGCCDGRITIEHVLIFAGRQLDQPWNLIPLCEYHHAVNKHQDKGDLNKEKNEWIALNRATPGELQAVSKVINYAAKKEYLNKKYGVPSFS